VNQRQDKSGKANQRQVLVIVTLANIGQDS